MVLTKGSTLDFGVIEETYALDLLKDFPISHLAEKAPVLRLLRKPDFQRETNHWSPEQLVTFIESFVDNEVIPSLIFWKSSYFIFVIDGGHRISALRAWMEDDYGDKHISRSFYKKELPKKQVEIADRTRNLVKRRVGTYADLKGILDVPNSDPVARQRAQTLFTRGLPLQWIVQANASAAETSFFKINSQGTPLDETETLLIKNRKKPVAIAARAILRAGSGHKYWSSFDQEHISQIELVTQQMHEHVFKPEVDEPLKTMELPLGGSVSPVDALGLLVEFLGIAGTRTHGRKSIDQYEDDSTGAGTVNVLRNSYEVLDRISGTGSGSLGLHPAVYFYNDRGRYSRFLFLAIASIIQEKIRNNNKLWFKQFTSARSALEAFLVANKSVISMIVVNLNKNTRVDKMRDLIEFLVREFKEREHEVTIELAIAHLGLTGRIVDVRAVRTVTDISDDTKTEVFLRTAMPKAMLCPICSGVLDPKKCATYDHMERVRDGGSGDPSNVQMVHPYCNTGYKN